jgi:hypothetical protein
MLEKGAPFMQISPNAAAIKRYYEELAQYDAFDAQHELARKTAFQSLLQAVAPQVKWTLIRNERWRVPPAPRSSRRHRYGPARL